MPNLDPPILDPPNEEDIPLLERPLPPKTVLEDPKLLSLWTSYWDRVMEELEESEKQLRRNQRKR